MSRYNKYGARKVTIKGHTFDSQKEADRYLVLLSRHQAGEIASLECHPSFELQPAFRDKNGKHHRAIGYIADFQYLLEPGLDLIIEDVKSSATKTQVFRIKQKLLLYKYPGINFVIVE